ncbi:MAG: TlpA disulfide reductase family protein [Chitinophagaceae bacterium]
MKSILLFLFLVPVLFLSAQYTSADAVAVLKKVSQKLDALPAVRYRQIREMKYHADNYYAIDSATMYIEFKPDLPAGMRFQAERRETFFIYNGLMSITLNNKSKTVDTAGIRSVKYLESNSFAYFSLASLRNNLPIVIANDSISKFLSDTTIDGKELFSVRIEGAGMYLNSFKGINYFTEPGLRRPYFLLIDKRTLHPCQLISKLVQGNDDRDFITVTYRDIQSGASGPDRNTWTYSAYQGKYSPFIPPVKTLLIKPGAVVPAFKFPVYHPLKKDSLSIADLKGKVVLLEFWFKACGPCLKAMPHYNNLQEKFGKDGFELVTINIEDSIQDIAFFYDKYPPTYPMLYNGISLFERLGFSGCPSSLLVDRDGRAVRTFITFNQPVIEQSISELLKPSTEISVTR